MDELDKFEKYLLNKKEFLESLLLIVHADAYHSIQLQLETVDDIIHHFNVLVKGEQSIGIGHEE